VGVKWFPNSLEIFTTVGDFRSRRALLSRNDSERGAASQVSAEGGVGSVWEDRRLAPPDRDGE
jgi:hypothetical protein